MLKIFDRTSIIWQLTVHFMRKWGDSDLQKLLFSLLQVCI